MSKCFFVFLVLCASSLTACNTLVENLPHGTIISESTDISGHGYGVEQAKSWAAHDDDADNLLIGHGVLERAPACGYHALLEQTESKRVIKQTGVAHTDHPDRSIHYRREITPCPDGHEAAQDAERAERATYTGQQ